MAIKEYEGMEGMIIIAIAALVLMVLGIQAKKNKWLGPIAGFNKINKQFLEKHRDFICDCVGSMLIRMSVLSFVYAVYIGMFSFPFIYGFSVYLSVFLAILNHYVLRVAKVINLFYKHTVISLIVFDSFCLFIIVNELFGIL